MISNFQEIRRDGKVIPEGMTSVQMIVLGWEPDIDAATGAVLGAEEVH